MDDPAVTKFLTYRTQTGAEMRAAVRVAHRDGDFTVEPFFYQIDGKDVGAFQGGHTLRVAARFVTKAPVPVRQCPDCGMLSFDEHFPLMSALREKKAAMPTKFKAKAMQDLYEGCRRLAADKSSEFYHAGAPRSGAAHRNAYWNGRRGLPAAPLFGRGTLAYACWRAGADDYKAAGKMVPELPKFIAAQAAA